MDEGIRGFLLAVIPLLTGGLIGYGDLRAKVSAERERNQERYAEFSKKLDKLDRRQEDLIDFLMRTRVAREPEHGRTQN